MNFFFLGDNKKTENDNLSIFEKSFSGFFENQSFFIYFSN